MSVYVDTEAAHGWQLRGRNIRSCHMIADTQEELHAMAERIGLKRSWFQAKSSPHYDLMPEWRRSALRHGAIWLRRPAFVAKLRELRGAGWP